MAAMRAPMRLLFLALVATAAEESCSNPEESINMLQAAHPTEKALHKHLNEVKHSPAQVVHPDREGHAQVKSGLVEKASVEAGFNIIVHVSSESPMKNGHRVNVHSSEDVLEAVARSKVGPGGRLSFNMVDVKEGETFEQIGIESAFNAWGHTRDLILIRTEEEKEAAEELREKTWLESKRDGLCTWTAECYYTCDAECPETDDYGLFKWTGDKTTDDCWGWAGRSRCKCCPTVASLRATERKLRG